MIVKVDMTGADALLRAVNPSVAKKALNRTLKEVMTSGINAGQREVTKTYNLKSSQLKRYINNRVVSKDGLEVSVSIRSKSYVSLFNFINKGSIQSSLTRKNKNSKSKVKVKIIKSGGSHTLRHAFVMIGKNGNIGIFERVRGVKSSNGNDKIVRLNTVGPIGMFEKAGLPIIQENVTSRAADVLKRNLAFYMSKESLK